jgi:nucleoid-associated protein YgaU
LQGQVKELGDQLTSLRGENARFARAGEAAAALRAELAETKTRLADAQKAAEQHGASVAELTGLNQRLAVEKTDLERRLARDQQGAEGLRTELADLRARVAASGKSTQEQLATIDQLGAANEKLQGQVKELGGQLAALRGENAKLASSGDAAAAAVRAELAEVRTKLGETQKAAETYGGTVAELTGANEKLSTELKELQGALATLRGENIRLAQSDAARQDAEQRAASLAAAATQLTTAQRDLASARSEIARLSDTVQALEKDRTTRVAQLQQENLAIAARLRQAQGTLDQIASAARLLNGGGSAAPLPPASVQSTPTTPPLVTPAPRYHTVQEGESLTRISMRFYGSPNRWQDIYDANREVLKGENSLRPGQRLRIP